jgi:hypothetical protein
MAAGSTPVGARPKERGSLSRGQRARLTTRQGTRVIYPYALYLVHTQKIPYEHSASSASQMRMPAPPML